MKITRTRLTEIVAEEVMRALSEAPDDEEGGDDSGKKSKKKPTTASADSEPTLPQNGVPAGPRVKPADASPGDPAPEDGGKSAGAADASDDDTPDPNASAMDADGNAGEESSGAVNNEISGKNIQSISVEPKSKILPGSKEVVLTFSETTDALRIMITATGRIVFFWRGQTHDVP